MAVATPHKMTADEFFALPDELPHPQLIDGELVVNTPQFRHQRIIYWLAHRFFLHREGHPGCGELLGEIDTPIDEHNVFKPDLWWLPEERIMDGSASRHVAPPPLVVEVRSPSTWRYDTGTKLRSYERSGVAQVWLVDTAIDVVVVHHRSRPDAPDFDRRDEHGATDVLSTPLVPGWEIDLATLFAQ